MTMVVPSLSHIVVISHLLLQPLARRASSSWPYRSCLRPRSISTTADSLHLWLTCLDHHFAWSTVCTAPVACPRRMRFVLVHCYSQSTACWSRGTMHSCMRFDTSASSLTDVACPLYLVTCCSHSSGVSLVAPQ
jgi:hypothetical protein